MPDTRAELVELYGRHKVAEVVLTPDYQQICTRYEGNRLFDSERDLVETVKRRLESRLEVAGMTATNQVKAALVELNKHRLERDVALYYALIVRAYKPDWGDTHQKYFEAAWHLLSCRYDFFLSFTTRYGDATENPVNQRYRHFIIDIIDRPQYQRADRAKRNLLAEALYQMLAQPPRRGFMFTQHQNDNAVTETKLTETAANTSVFVQLVQNVMFVRPEGRPNYCYFEYHLARELIPPPDEDRLLFIVAEESRESLVPAYDVPEPYESWYDHVKAKDPPYLENARDRSSQRIRTLRQRIEEKIVRQVDDVRRKVFDNVPS